jgi:hypothetical protein
MFGLDFRWTADRGLASSNLSKRRYAEHDDTLYVAPEDERTDYARPFPLCVFIC